MSGLQNPTAAGCTRGSISNAPTHLAAAHPGLACHGCPPPGRTPHHARAATPSARQTWPAHPAAYKERASDACEPAGAGHESLVCTEHAILDGVEARFAQHASPHAHRAALTERMSSKAVMSSSGSRASSVTVRKVQKVRCIHRMRSSPTWAAHHARSKRAWVVEGQDGRLWQAQRHCWLH